ncbi:MAG: DUF2513 domain-containing protein [Gammaproteobacteria bacterium]|nr:DUF2513 domain-containing protein [Gammaproteobacteria bacterium]
MKRDDDFLRELLIQMEESNDRIFIVPNTLDGANSKEIHHILILCDYGYAEQLNDHAYRLTAHGHDFIDSIRDDSVWEKTKAAVAETGGNATIEMIKTLATGFLKKKVSEHTGIEI